MGSVTGATTPLGGPLKCIELNVYILVEDRTMLEVLEVFRPWSYCEQMPKSRPACLESLEGHAIMEFKVVYSAHKAYSVQANKIPLSIITNWQLHRDMRFGQ